MFLDPTFWYVKVQSKTTLLHKRNQVFFSSIMNSFLMFDYLKVARISLLCSAKLNGKFTITWHCVFQINDDNKCYHSLVLNNDKIVYIYVVSRSHQSWRRQNKFGTIQTLLSLEEATDAASSRFSSAMMPWPTTDEDASGGQL